MPYSVNLFARIATSLFVFCLYLFASSTPSLAHNGPHVTVQPGDTLSQIALTHGYDLETFMRINELWDANQIYVGQQLAVPASGSEGAALQPALRPAPADWQIYIVQPGDSLSVLARDYRVGLARLAEVNKLSPAQNLYVGQVLRMPTRSSNVSSEAESSTASTSTATASTATTNTATTSIAPREEGSTSPQVHYVKQGEHLGTIATQYGTTPLAIAQANYLPDASHVIPGQRLVLPTANTTAASSSTVTSPAEISFVNYDHFPTTTEKWIDVNLSTQTVTAYDGTEPQASFLVSTGLPDTPTVQGTFRIWATTPIQDMYSLTRSGAEQPSQPDPLTREGYDYYLDDVEWVQYFHQDYAFHAAYWHNNFGQPMSHGCVNMRTDDAKWLFEWASPSASMSSWSYYSGYNRGTLVKVHE